MNQIFRKLHNENSPPFYINAKFDIKSMDLVIFQRNKAWKCFVTEGVLNKWCDEYQMPFNDYYNTLKEYLNNPPNNVNLSLNNNEFVVYRCLNRGRAKFFSTSLKETDYADYVENTLLVFHNENQEYKSKIATLETQQKKLETTNQEYATKLQEFIERKERDDEQLYSNFVQVLNEKKRKIQHLIELLESFRNGRSTINPPPIETKQRKRRKDDEALPTASTIQRKEMISESEESSCDEMQEEEETTSNGDDDNQSDVEEETLNAKTDDCRLNSSDDDDFVLPKRVKNSDIKPVEVKMPNSSTQSQQLEIKTVANEKQQPTIDTQELLDMV